MQIIPGPLRVRTVALLRTLMQGSRPLASTAAAVLLLVIGLSTPVGAPTLLIGMPGLLGLQAGELRVTTHAKAPRPA